MGHGQGAREEREPRSRSVSLEVQAREEREPRSRGPRQEPGEERGPRQEPGEERGSLRARRRSGVLKVWPLVPAPCRGLAFSACTT